VAPAMSHLAFEIAGRAFFGQDVSGASGVIRTEFAKLAAFLDWRFKHLFAAPVSWPTARNRRFNRASRKLINSVLAIIAQHRQGATDEKDLLSMLIEARDEETGERMTDLEICVEALTFLIAGHETTAKGLAWTLFQLASNPAVRERLCAEVDTVLNGDCPTFETLPRLTATRMAVEESLRLYPPVWAVTRQAMADDEIDGFRIPAKSTVAIVPYVTHRHPEFWPEPERFDIDRFTSERAGTRPKGAYLPFIFGPHQCIGMEFAMQEMCLVVAMVLERFDFDLEPGQTIRPVAALTLNPSGPIRIRLRERDTCGTLR
jgi:cytochrome P450